MEQDIKLENLNSEIEEATFKELRKKTKTEKAKFKTESKTKDIFKDITNEEAEIIKRKFYDDKTEFTIEQKVNAIFSAKGKGLVFIIMIVVISVSAILGFVFLQASWAYLDNAIWAWILCGVSLAIFFISTFFTFFYKGMVVKRKCKEVESGKTTIQDLTKNFTKDQWQSLQINLDLIVCKNLDISYMDLMKYKEKGISYSNSSVKNQDQKKDLEDKDGKKTKDWVY